MLSDMKFLDSLKEYDKDNIPPTIISKITSQYISNPDFDPSLIKNVSSACQGLCKWIIALIKYDSVYKVI
jgi:dynein heavy chain